MKSDWRAFRKGCCSQCLMMTTWEDAAVTRSYSQTAHPLVVSLCEGRARIYPRRRWRLAGDQIPASQVQAATCSVRIVSWPHDGAMVSSCSFEPEAHSRIERRTSTSQPCNTSVLLRLEARPRDCEHCELSGYSSTCWLIRGVRT